MIDLGVKEPVYGEPVEMTSTKKEIRYPTLYVSEVDLPFDTADVGKEFTIKAKIKVKEVSKREGKRDGNKVEKRKSFDLDFMSIEMISGKTSDEDDIKGMEKVVEERTRSKDAAFFGGEGEE